MSSQLYTEVETLRLMSAWKTDSAPRHHDAIARATPEWLTWAERQEMTEMYKRVAGTKRRRKKLSVDHIVPLRGKNVCGLHVPWNLQIIPLLDNQRKKNRHE